METVLKAIADWIKGILTAGIMSNLSGLFDDVNTQVGNIAQQVGTKPSSFEPRVFAMIEALSRNVVLPIAGIILTFIACYELIEMITQHNNMAQFEPALIMRWIFKTAVSVWLISNTFDIVMAVFDVTQKVVSDSSGIIAGNTRVNDIGLSMLQSSLMQMDVGPLFGLFLQSFFIGITMRILSIIIFVIVYDYHFDMGGLGNVFHICQFAEVMERNHADFYPEIQTQDEQAAWELGGKGYLAIQSCEDGWDYTLYHSDYSVMDGGQLDAPELTIQEAREQILEAHHMEKGRRLLQDYDAVMDKVAEAEELSADHRPSTLEKLAELASDTSAPKSSARSAPEL